VDFQTLLHDCVPPSYQERMARIVEVESGRNPYAIGVVGGHLVRQPRQLDEAIATAKALDRAGWNFSLGHAQVNKHNLGRMGLDYETAFDACRNLKAGAAILTECDQRAKQTYPDDRAQHAAHSCYYSGNFTRGFKPDRPGGTSYVQRVASAGGKTTRPIPVIPDDKPQAATGQREETPVMPAKWDVLGEFSAGSNSFFQSNQ